MSSRYATPASYLARITNWATVACDTHRHSAITALLGEVVGSSGDREVYCGDCWRFQYHRVRAELARVHRAPECRPFLVSCFIGSYLSSMI